MVDIINSFGRKRCFPYDSTKRATKFFLYTINIEYENPETFTTIEEKELYPFSQMLAEIGGFLGLMIGASGISVLELIVFSILTIAGKLLK